MSPKNRDFTGGLKMHCLKDYAGSFKVTVKKYAGSFLTAIVLVTTATKYCYDVG